MSHEEHPDKNEQQPEAKESKNTIPRTKEAVAAAINERGLADAEVYEAMLAFVDACHTEATVLAQVAAEKDPHDIESGPRATLNALIQIAEMQALTNEFKDVALEGFQDALMIAQQRDFLRDEANMLAKLVADLEERLGLTVK